jgi:hypothetical protein
MNELIQEHRDDAKLSTKRCAVHMIVVTVTVHGHRRTM